MNLEKAYAKARKAVESTYRGTLTMWEYRDVTDEVTRMTTQKECAVLTKVPCKLSFETITNAKQGEAAASVAQIVKLFVSPDVPVKPGCKIAVTQDNVTTDYTYSGVPAIYPTHKEIILELFERWA